MSIKVNLLPDIILQQRHEAQLRQRITFGLLGWLGVLVLFGGGTFLYQAFENNRLNGAQNDFDTLDADVNSEENVAFREEALLVQRGLEILSELTVDQTIPSQMLRTLAANTPEEVRLRDVTLSEDETIIITAEGPDHSASSRMLAALGTSQSRYVEGSGLGYFLDVDIIQSTASDDGVSFSLIAVFVQTEQPIDPAEDAAAIEEAFFNGEAIGPEEEDAEVDGDE